MCPDKALKTAGSGVQWYVLPGVEESGVLRAGDATGEQQKSTEAEQQRVGSRKEVRNSNNERAGWVKGGAAIP